MSTDHNHNHGMAIPAPTPPWLRPVQSPMVQRIYGEDTIDLGVDVTYLEAANAPTAGYFKVALPNGNYIRQYHQIFVAGDKIPTTAPFYVIGSISGANSLLFNNSAFSAVLTWDGGSWCMIGGNAQPSSTVPV